MHYIKTIDVISHRIFVMKLWCGLTNLNKLVFRLESDLTSPI